LAISSPGEFLLQHPRAPYKESPISTRAHWRNLVNTNEQNDPTRVHNPNGKSIDSAIFAQVTAQSPYTLPPPPSLK